MGCSAGKPCSGSSSKPKPRTYSASKIRTVSATGFGKPAVKIRYGRR